MWDKGLSQGEEEQRNWEEVEPGSLQEEEQGQAPHFAFRLSHHQTECLRHRRSTMGKLWEETQ